MDVVIFLEYRANRSRPLPKTAALPFVSSFDTIHACYTQLLTVSQISLPLSHLNDFAYCGPSDGHVLLCHFLPAEF